MGMIFDGRGSGKRAEVDQSYRLLTRAYSESIQHSLSHDEGQAYQVIGETNLSAGTVIPLFIKNVSNTRNMVVTYCRHQIIGASGGTDFPNTSNYFRMVLGRRYVSGGTEVDAINLNTEKGNVPELLIYGDNPTLSGTGEVIDKWYTKANGDMNTFNKEGAVIIAPQGSIELSYIGDQTSGFLYTRMSFLMMENH